MARGRTKKTLEETVKQELPEFYEEVQTLNDAQVRDRLAKNVKDREDILEAKADDEDFAAARREASALGQPYRDGLKLNRMRARYMLKILKDRGQS